MRTIALELSDDEAEVLSELAERQKISLESFMREAIAAYVDRCLGPDDDAFGLWSDRAEVDGLAYQRAVRSEW